MVGSDSVALMIIDELDRIRASENAELIKDRELEWWYNHETTELLWFYAEDDINLEEPFEYFWSTDSIGQLI